MTKYKIKIPMAKPYTDAKEIKLVNEVIKSGILSLGNKLKQFEKSFAKYIGTKYAVGVNSGTSGLHLSLLSLGLKEGDEVITSPFSFVASSNCILYVRAKPIFVDIDPATYNINPKKIPEAITSRTKSLLPLHIFGHPCDMDKIMKIAHEHNLSVVEDACESIGSEYNGKKVGTFGISSVFAFYPNKQMTTGEGGIVVTNDEKTYKLCKSLSNQGRGDDMSWLVHERLGYNYRLDEMSCALGVEQLKKLKYMLKKRIELAKLYTKLLSKVDGVKTPYVDPRVRHTWFLYTIRLEEEIDRNKVMKFFGRKGIDSKAYFDPPIHLQPFYRKMFGFKEGDFPICEEVSRTALSLPFFIQMKREEVETVCNTLENAIAEVSK